MNIISTPPPQKTEEEKELERKYHRTRAIIYGACWFAGGVICFFSTAVGALIGRLFGAKGMAYGALICLWLGVISIGAFFILAIYHLIKWLNV